VRNFTQAEIDKWFTMIGQKVWKNPKTTTKFQPKPFKSGRKVNTIKSIVVHRQTGGWGFTFEEDDSVVECFRCSIAPEQFVPHDIGGRGTTTMEVFAAQKIDDGFVPSYMYEGAILRG
jgi:hypothetical protein